MPKHKEGGITEIVEAVNTLLEAVATLYNYKVIEISREISGVHSKTENLNELLMQIDGVIRKLDSCKLLM